MLYDYFQGWLHSRPVNEQSVFMDLFESSFPFVYRQAIQNWTFKMEALECFIIVQVNTSTAKLYPEYFNTLIIDGYFYLALLHCSHTTLAICISSHLSVL